MHFQLRGLYAYWWIWWRTGDMYDSVKLHADPTGGSANHCGIGGQWRYDRNSSGCKSEHQEMDNVEVVLNEGEEPLKPAMFIDSYNYTDVGILNKMLSVGLASWVSDMNNSGLNLCAEVGCEADTDMFGSGYGEGPIATDPLRRKVRRDSGTILWEREGLVAEEIKRSPDERCIDDGCGSSMVCHYAARMCNAPDSIQVVAGTKADPYANHLNIIVTLDTTSDGFSCDELSEDFTLSAEVLAPIVGLEFLPADAFAGIELESICGAVQDVGSIFG